MPLGSYEVSAIGKVGVHAFRVLLEEDLEYDIVLEEGEKLSGFVYYDLNNSGDRQVEEGLADVVLTYTNEEGRKLFFLTNKLGAYEAMLVPETSYSLLVDATGFNEVVRPLSTFEELEGEPVFSVSPKNITVSGLVLLNDQPLVEENLDIEFLSLGNGSVGARTRSFNGAYSVDLRPGDYAVVINQNISLSGDLRYQNREEDRIKIAIGQDEKVYDIVVVQRGLVQGTVELGGEPINATIDLLGPEVVTLDVADGRFQTFLTLGEYTASSNKEIDGTEYSLIEGFRVSGGTSIELSFERSTRITGSLRYKESIVRKELDIEFKRSIGGSITIRTESSGRYEGYLLWGEYSVHVEHSTTESQDGVTRYLKYTHDSALIIQQGESTAVYDIQIEKAFENSSVFGRVFLKGEGTSSEIIARDPSAMNVTAYSDPNGNYSTEVMPGEYSIFAQKLPGHYVHLGGVSVPDHSEVRYDIDLRKGYRVSGVVTFGENQRKVSKVEFTANGSVQLLTDDAGHYELYLGYGEYQVRASTIVEEKGAMVTYEASKSILVKDISAVNLELTKAIRRSVSLSWDSSQRREIAQGQSVRYVITVTNNGNVEDTFNFEGSGPSDDWVFTFTPSAVVLDYGDVGSTASVVAQIKTPMNASVDHGPLRVTARSENNSATAHSVTLELDIKKVRGMNLTLATL
ncbi:MAG: hypothetical protein ACE5KV_08345, partial [Thermoplasmata archaeon]